MKLLGLALGAALSTALTLTASADTQRPTVAVYVDRGSEHLQEASQFADRVTESLVKNGQFSVIDRSHVATILNEQSAAVSGQVTPATESQLGRMLGANYLVVVRLNNLNAASEQRVDVMSFLTKQASVVTKLTLSDSAEILDVRSAQIVQSVSDSQQMTSPASQSANDAFIHEALPQILGTSADAIVSKLDTSKLSSQPQAEISGRILDISGGSITVSIGSDAGINVGQVLDFFDQHNVLNPDTGKTITTLVKRGSIQIVQVEKDYAIAKPMAMAAPIKFQIVRAGS